MMGFILKLLSRLHYRKHGYPSRAYLTHLYRSLKVKQFDRYRETYNTDFLPCVVLTPRLHYAFTLYQRGKTLAEIASVESVTSERIRMYLCKVERVLNKKINDLG